MPRISLSLEVPQSDYDQLQEVADAEGVKIRSLLVWTMRAEIATRAAAQALLRRKSCNAEEVAG
jgi:hypothetical protein